MILPEEISGTAVLKCMQAAEDEAFVVRAQAPLEQL